MEMRQLTHLALFIGETTQWKISDVNYFFENPIAAGLNGKGKPQQKRKCKLCLSPIVADLLTC